MHPPDTARERVCEPVRQREKPMHPNDCRKLTAPCGLDCFNCEIHVDNITPDFQKRVAQTLGKSLEAIPCPGCRQNRGCKLFSHECETFLCAEEHNVAFCFQCADFPCSKLQPAREGADRYPHNFKLYNLCRIQAVGVEEWSRNEAALIRKKYFSGTFVPGTGPVIK